MARTRSEATQQWYAKKAANWRKKYGWCTRLQEIVAADSEQLKRSFSFRNYSSVKVIDADAFHREVDAIKNRRESECL